MVGAGIVLAKVLAGIAAYEGLIYAGQLQERREVYSRAEAYAKQADKPLLVVGAPKLAFNHGCGDVTMDLSPKWLGSCPHGQVGDIRDIPYPNKHFGASFASHVLEHLATPADCAQALSELDRVSDQVFIVVPRKDSIMAWMSPDHHLWVTPIPEGFLVEQR